MGDLVCRFLEFTGITKNKKDEGVKRGSQIIGFNFPQNIYYSPVLGVNADMLKFKTTAHNTENMADWEIVERLKSQELLNAGSVAENTSLSMIEEAKGNPTNVTTLGDEGPGNVTTIFKGNLVNMMPKKGSLSNKSIELEIPYIIYIYIYT